MPDMPWLNAEEEIQKLREIRTLEWICHLIPTDLPWEVQRALRNTFVRGAPVSLRSSVIALLCRPDLIVGTVVTEFGNLIVTGVIRCHGGRGQVAAFNCQRQGKCADQNGQESKQNSKQSAFHKPVVWPVVHSVHRSEKDRKPTKFLICICRKVVSQVNKSPT